jgi:hypothetical protein
MLEKMNAADRKFVQDCIDNPNVNRRPLRGRMPPSLRGSSRGAVCDRWR